jgi:hypothetical protein
MVFQKAAEKLVSPLLPLFDYKKFLCFFGCYCYFNLYPWSSKQAVCGRHVPGGAPQLLSLGTVHLKSSPPVVLCTRSWHQVSSWTICLFHPGHSQPTLAPWFGHGGPHETLVEMWLPCWRCWEPGSSGSSGVIKRTQCLCVRSECSLLQGWVTYLKRVVPRVLLSHTCLCPLCFLPWVAITAHSPHQGTGRPRFQSCEVREASFLVNHPGAGTLWQRQRTVREEKSFCGASRRERLSLFVLSAAFCCWDKMRNNWKGERICYGFRPWSAHGRLALLLWAHGEAETSQQGIQSRSEMLNCESISGLFHWGVRAFMVQSLPKKPNKGNEAFKTFHIHTVKLLCRSS